MAHYSTNAAQLRSIRFEGGVVTAIDKAGLLVVPVSLDYGIWAERTARRAEEFVAIEKAAKTSKGSHYGRMDFFHPDSAKSWISARSLTVRRF